MLEVMVVVMLEVMVVMLEAMEVVMLEVTFFLFSSGISS